ncbi:GDT1 3 [Olea europaea subsp. europaea]|uniref:GDT1 family protein n=1 Tax=Olea europaea subsp. europaea TaxID=158383 RepID=A0A8S0T0N9_OLEEU|nr:GDT1 3 [Olea europaea subsp. europaea]
MLFLKSNPFHSSSFSLYLFVAFLLFLFFSPLVIFAQDSGREESNAGIKDLGRRSKIFVDKIKTGVAIDEIDHDSINLGVELDSGLGVFDAFFASFSMILVSEIGDETFIIAALMAMRHPKSIVLSGALSALFVMTVLSTGLGRIVPNLISRKHTNSAATVLYAFFGLRLLYIAWRSDPKCSQKKEMEEVEEKLETGQGKTTFRRFFSRFCTPIYLEVYLTFTHLKSHSHFIVTVLFFKLIKFGGIQNIWKLNCKCLISFYSSNNLYVQSFILTFLAEWGDRSQIATIAVRIFHIPPNPQPPSF